MSIQSLGGADTGKRVVNRIDAEGIKKDEILIDTEDKVSVGKKGGTPEDLKTKIAQLKKESAKEAVYVTPGDYNTGLVASASSTLDVGEGIVGLYDVKHNDVQRFSSQLTSDNITFETKVAEQKSISIEKMLNNCQESGAILASSEKGHAYEGFHWLRDSSIIAREMVSSYEDSGDSRLKGAIEGFIDFTKKNQETDSEFGMGETRFLAANGKADGTPWARPQNDGPALRSIAITSYAEVLMKQGKSEQVPKRIYSVVKKDLDYLVEHGDDLCFDLWEDTLGHHFFTQILIRRALHKGAKLALSLGNRKDSMIYKKAAKKMEPGIEKHFDKEKDFLVSFLDVKPLKSSTSKDYQKRTGLDISVIMGLVYAHDPDDSFMKLDDPRVMKTMDALKGSFRELYGINKDWTEKGNEGFAIGRFAEDHYPGYILDKRPDNEEGNPWFISTLAVVTYNALLSRDLLKQGKVAESKKAAKESKAFMKWTMAHIPADGMMSEQINRHTGKPQGVKDLTWSYQTFIQAASAQEKIS